MPPLPGISRKTTGLLSHSGDVTSAFLLRRALYLEDELDSLLDESWLNEGLERLSTLKTLTGTVSALRTKGAPLHSQIAALESCWYMRNQLLRDTDWSSMAHGLEVRVPFVDMSLLNHLGPAIASGTPPNKQDLAACAEQLPMDMLSRPKTGFTTPVREWIGGGADGSSRGLRGWASTVHQRFRTMSKQGSTINLSLAAE
jgi:asparagine synthase (glutamine-hydrolysing)